MSQDHKANVLYNRHLDFSVTDVNKELEDAKGNYPAMKSLLVEKWGTCDLVCDQYLEGIKKVAMPTDPRDKAGMLAYVKNAAMLRWSYKSLEIMLDEPGIVPKVADAAADVHSYASSSSGDDQPNPPSCPSGGRSDVRNQAFWTPPWARAIRRLRHTIPLATGRRQPGPTWWQGWQQPKRQHEPRGGLAQ
jgi:hypothetical protein